MGKRLTGDAVIRHWPDAYVVARFATIQKGVRAPGDGDLIVGQGATIVGAVRAERSLYLSKDVIVRGRASAGVDVVVGAYATIQGDVEAGGNILVLEGAHVRGSVRAKGSVRIIGARIDGSIDAAGDVEIRAEAGAKDVTAGGRVRTLEPPQELP